MDNPLVTNLMSAISAFRAIQEELEVDYELAPTNTPGYDEIGSAMSGLEDVINELEAALEYATDKDETV